MTVWIVSGIFFFFLTQRCCLLSSSPCPLSLFWARPSVVLLFSDVVTLCSMFVTGRTCCVAQSQSIISSDVFRNKQEVTLTPSRSRELLFSFYLKLYLKTRKQALPWLYSWTTFSKMTLIQNNILYILDLEMFFKRKRCILDVKSRRNEAEYRVFR